MTHRHTWCPCHALSLPVASLPYPVSFPGNLVSDGLANAALASLSALCWRSCPHCTVGITSIALSSSPALRWCLCSCHVGTFALVALDLSPLLHPRCHQYRKLASAPSRGNHDTSAYVALSLCSLLLPVVFCCRNWHHSPATWPWSIRGSLGAMIPFYLNWLVCRCFLAKK
jgi:hypothetical protein